MRVLATHIPFQFAGTQTTVSVLHTGSTQLAAASDRKYLLIQNLDSANAVHLSLDGTAATTSDFILAAGGGSLELAEGVPTGQINAIAVTATCSVVVLEG
jgi:hypothetical protein